MIRKYEVMYILDQDLKDTKELTTKLDNILTEGGKMINSKDLGLIDFAYEINHKKKGFYRVVIVETTAEAIKEFERVAKIDKNVVRTLVLNTENNKNYEESVELSKTDMSKFEEEQREKRNFKKVAFKKEEPTAKEVK
ncbi:30S ribosomal protein S6 [Mycoplasma putrefaciens]|uniref:Small ribosomal subunit protein bS6 n=1 Tax=Mycoplasma putrefaciens (strain ATCC 15718 / NCTC 10155 / C30 KS-1 / KS-1) TaxID=743965 RepID=A0A7U3ZS13_MYCPK|nr:30S ribosomal protein S6 [Mycoplasma putrefaciens]AEM68451.1 ribosomal protein S6 [Mycoplasma putrefaciens KS1]SYV94851.1 30S ribosomal protein S6 [Mycoplasma putrefaciens]